MMLCIVALLLLIITIIVYYIYYNSNKEHFQIGDKSAELIRLINDEYSKGLDLQSVTDEEVRNKYDLIQDIDGGYAQLKNKYNIFNKAPIKGYPKIPIVGSFNTTDYLKLEDTARKECATQNNCKAYSIGYNSKTNQYSFSLFDTDDLANIGEMPQGERGNWGDNYKTVLRNTPLSTHNKLLTDAKIKYDTAIKLRENGEKIFTQNYEIYNDNKVPNNYKESIIKIGSVTKNVEFDKNKLISSGAKYNYDKQNTLIKAINECNKTNKCKGILIVSEQRIENNKLFVNHYFIQLGINNTDNLVDIKTKVPSFNGSVIYLSRKKVPLDTMRSTFGGKYVSDMIKTRDTPARADAPFNNKFKFEVYENADTLRPDVKDVIVSKGEPFNQGEYNKMLEEAQKACILDKNCSAFVAAYDIRNSILFYRLKRDDTEDSDNNNQFEFDNDTLKKYKEVVTYVKVTYKAPLGMPPKPVDKVCANVNYYNHISSHCVEGEQVPTVGVNKICNLKPSYTHEVSMCENLTSVTSEDEDGRFHLDDKIETIYNVFNKIAGLSKSLKTQKYNDNIELFKKLLINIWNNSVTVFFADPINVGVGNTAGYAIVTSFDDIRKQNVPNTKLGILLESLYNNCQYTEFNNVGYCDSSKFYNDLQRLYVTSRILELADL